MKWVTNRFALCLVASLSLLGTAGPATPDEARAASAAPWHFEGYAALLDAAGRAKVKQRRLLVGLSGGGT